MPGVESLPTIVSKGPLALGIYEMNYTGLSNPDF